MMGLPPSSQAEETTAAISEKNAKILVVGGGAGGIMALARLHRALPNADITIIAQAPKMAPHISAMCRNIADDLNSGIDTINIKATTTEKLGFEGRKEGIAVQAAVLIEK